MLPIWIFVVIGSYISQAAYGILYKEMFVK